MASGEPMTFTHYRTRGGLTGIGTRFATHHLKGETSMGLILLWLFGVPAGLLLLLFVLGVGH